LIENIDLTASIIVDDYSIDEKRIRPVHGLSIYIEAYNSVILFDTGPDASILQENSEALGVDLSLVDTVVISHIHTDHIGGIPHIGWVSPAVKTYIPYASGQQIENYIKKHGLVPVEVMDWLRISNNIVISKSFYGPPWEHVLIIRTGKGLVLFTGCAHKGILSIIEEITSYLDDEVYAIVGGLHLDKAPYHIITNTLEELVKKVKYIVPLHCSGNLTRTILLQKYPDKLIKAFAGSIVNL